LENPVPLTVPLADNEVNAPVLGIELPIGPGDANVAPLREEAFKFGMLVLDATTRGAVPGETVELICALA
jgi:hypothetical protein